MGKSFFNSFFLLTENLYLLIVFLLFPCLSCVTENSQKILVVSFDGFRHDYPNINTTPTIMKLGLEGTITKFMHNVFETKTFPNHHSIGTGLYPDVHGVISNSFYDPVYKQVIKYGEDMWRYDDNVVPIWIHNEECNPEHYSGVYMWPGSNFKYHNKLPTFVQNFSANIPWTKRVDTVLKWFLHSETPANLVMMYFEEPDSHSHKYGANSSQVQEQLRRIDNITYYLQNKIVDMNLSNSLNVFLLSDHGMVSVPPENLIKVKELIQSHSNECLMAGVSPILHVIPTKDKEEDLYSILKNLSQHSNFSVYLRSELPSQWLYKNCRRIPPIMLVADEGYAFDDIYDNGTVMYGVHGYDNKLPSMHPFFIAYGPVIKKNYNVPPFKSVDLFNLFCHILGLKTLNTNGTLDIVQTMLLPSQSSRTNDPEWHMTNLMIAGMVMLVLLPGCLLIVFTKYLYNYCIMRKYDGSNGFSVSKEFENIHLLDSDDME